MPGAVLELNQMSLLMKQMYVKLLPTLTKHVLHECLNSVKSFNATIKGVPFVPSIMTKSSCPDTMNISEDERDKWR